MKSIIKFAVSNPVTICMLVLAILLLGKISYDQLAVDLLPDLNNPRLFIELKAGERPPEEIEKQFVKNMESMAIRQSDVNTGFIRDPCPVPPALRSSTLGRKIWMRPFLTCRKL